ncbi:helix-turn-helix domain-containing protein [Brevundimonas sp. DC300-4]|uniref:TetR/AcrR family transcriptional regulator n=1 Tax=Brevundimonas sp. DC300-4 TaxID=2804594 RepID=UPI003CF0A3F9
METVAIRGRPRQFDEEGALTEAMKLFWLLGYDATSMRDLGKAMSLSQPSIYAAFGNKAELYLHALKAFETGVSFLDMSALTRAPSLTQGVNRLLENLIRRLTKTGSPKGCMILSGTVAALAEQSALTVLLIERRGDYETALFAALQAWLPRHKAKVTAAMLTIFARGLSDRARDGCRAPELRRSVSEFCSVVGSGA